MNGGNISEAPFPVFALMRNMVPDVKDGLITIRVYSTNSKSMMYITRRRSQWRGTVDGDCHIGGVPGTGSEVLIDFRDLGGAA